MGGSFTARTAGTAEVVTCESVDERSPFPFSFSFVLGCLLLPCDPFLDLCSGVFVPGNETAGSKQRRCRHILGVLHPLGCASETVHSRPSCRGIRLQYRHQTILLPSPGHTTRTAEQRRHLSEHGRSAFSDICLLCDMIARARHISTFVLVSNIHCSTSNPFDFPGSHSISPITEDLLL